MRAYAAGEIPTELRVALPKGLSDEHRCNLAAADAALDEMTCSTIHGFCQRLITPYPVEADIDPGAAVMDRVEADRAFARDHAEAWLREELAGVADSLLAELVLHDPNTTVGLIHVPSSPNSAATEPSPPTSGRTWRSCATAFRETAEGLQRFPVR